MNYATATEPDAHQEIACSTKASGSAQFKPNLIERQLFKTLAQLKHGELELSYHGHMQRFGSPAEDGLCCRVTLHNRKFFKELAFGGSLGAAESYLQGDWSADDLTSLLRLMCRNLDALSGMDSGLARIGLWFAKLAHRLSQNSKSGSQKNIAAHYDLSNEFFALFLDPTLMYSSALFTNELESLEQASLHKLDTICRKLQLSPEDHVVEIGTGWGGFAVYAAQNYGCRITTTTISKNQYEIASQRITSAGLQDRVELLLTDYRDLQGTYQKLVSVEMIEAVGHAYLPTYFSTCDRLLKPGGTMLVQSITMPDQRYDAYLKSADFIQKYIFPGGHLPSIAAMQNAHAANTKLRLVSAHQFPDSYAFTLREWRDRFFANMDTVRKLGFDDRFIRMWDYYMCYCEAAFLERSVSVGQFVWEKAKY